MTKKDIMDLLATLPKGGITKKRIKKPNGKVYEYYFLQWTENGKQISRSLKNDEVETIRKQLDDRKKLEQVLLFGNYSVKEQPLKFHTKITTGLDLIPLVERVKKYKKRDWYKRIEEFVYGEIRSRVLVLYGLKNTGKTTLMKQIIADMKFYDILQTAFIQITQNDSLEDIYDDLDILRNNGFKYVFINEVTLSEDFIKNSALLSDIYAASGMKIVLSGSDSLSFIFAKRDQLFDRCFLLHTTFIPYREQSEFLGQKELDTYIRYGGTMSESRLNSFRSLKSTEDYISNAISENIKNSMDNYRYDMHFKSLEELLDNNELTNAINMVIEDINRRFTFDVIEKAFKDDKLLYPRLKKIIDDTHNKHKLDITDSQYKEIEKYLFELDIIFQNEIRNVDPYKEDRQRIVFTQPGLRYSQAHSIVSSIAENPLFKNLPLEEQKYMKERILIEIRGRMVEDIVLLETKVANPTKTVIKFQFEDGAFNMVVSDYETLESQVFILSNDKEPLTEKSNYLIDEDKCYITSYRHGTIVKKTVLYKGENTMLDGIYYQNIEEYLLSLKNG